MADAERIHVDRRVRNLALREEVRGFRCSRLAWLCLRLHMEEKAYALIDGTMGAGKTVVLVRSASAIFPQKQAATN